LKKRHKKRENNIKKTMKDSNHAHDWMPIKHYWMLSILMIPSLLSAQTTRQENSLQEITHENVAYGDHPNQVIDFWKADVDGPAPLVIFIHGGGFRGGSHDKVQGKVVQQYLNAGIHHASIEYRFLQHARFPAPHDDCVRALQFIRSKANDWGIDKSRIAGYGGSAGAQLVAYLAWGDDFADPDSDDPISMESSRLTAVAPNGGQSTLDLDWWVEHIPGYKKAFHRQVERGDLSMIEQRALLHELSIINHISPDDAPTFMSYGMDPEDPIPNDPKRARGWSIHHVRFGLVMEKKLRQEGVEVFLKHPQVELPFANAVDFLIHHLQK
jgi:acetyl esterase